jgi:hypothetical protein
MFLPGTHRKRVLIREFGFSEPDPYFFLVSGIRTQESGSSFFHTYGNRQTHDDDTPKTC